MYNTKNRPVLAVIVDDEVRSRSILRTMLARCCPEVTLAGDAATVEEALEIISSLQPDIVFLDIELGNGSGFDLLGQLEHIPFRIIFVTAFESFAIKAIKWSACDYLLKPVDPAELKTAVARALQSPAPAQEEHHPTARLALPTSEGLLFLDTEKVLYCASEGRYTRFYLSEAQKKILITRNLGEYEAVLTTQGFVRIHHQYIVNMRHVSRYVRGRGGCIVMSNGTELPVSTRRKDDFFGRLQQ